MPAPRSTRTSPGGSEGEEGGSERTPPPNSSFTPCSGRWRTEDHLPHLQVPISRAEELLERYAPGVLPAGRRGEPPVHCGMAARGRPRPPRPGYPRILDLPGAQDPQLLRQRHEAGRNGQPAPGALRAEPRPLGGDRESRRPDESLPAEWQHLSRGVRTAIGLSWGAWSAHSGRMPALLLPTPSPGPCPPSPPVSAPTSGPWPTP
jgi:hypothetical protein